MKRSKKTIEARHAVFPRGDRDLNLVIAREAGYQKIHSLVSRGIANVNAMKGA